jgi:GMP synthase (glutamine-hydrolysing)
VIGLQFHPEVAHTSEGRTMIDSFVRDVCGCTMSWTPGVFIDETVEAIRTQVGDGRVLCALSGGVDSAVAATLIARAVGDQLTCVFVDNGLLRQDEAEQLEQVFHRHIPARFARVDAADRFQTGCVEWSIRKRSAASSVTNSFGCLKAKHETSVMFNSRELSTRM